MVVDVRSDDIVLFKLRGKAVARFYAYVKHGRGESMSTFYKTEDSEKIFKSIIELDKHLVEVKNDKKSRKKV